MKIQPMTNNLLSLLKESGFIKIAKNKDRKSIAHLDKVFEDFRDLAKSGDVRVYESSVDPYEMIVVSPDQRFGRSFIV